MYKPLIIGVSGRARHGKDAVAQVLLQEFNVKRLAFADHLKWLAMHTWNLSWAQLYGDQKEVVDPRWGLTPRFLMQRLGTEVGRNTHKETWVRKAFDTIERARRGEHVTLPHFSVRADEPLPGVEPLSEGFHPFIFGPGAAAWWVIPDVRFPDEAEAIKREGGTVIKVVRPGLERPADGHASETSVDEVVEDHLVQNDGTLGDLVGRVVTLGERILAPRGFDGGAS